MTNEIRGKRRSRWGDDDQKGAANLLTPEHTLAALSSVREGRMIDLSHDIMPGHPMMAPAQSPLLMSLWSTADTTRRTTREHWGVTNELGAFTERVELCMHTGTHVDALGHITIGDEMFNGWTYQTSTNAYGLERLGIEQMPPVITRGVAIDLSGLDGGDFLDGPRPVTKKDLTAALDRAGAGIEEGDVVMIRTGWGRFFMKENERYVSSEPGLDVEAAQWLTEQGVVAIGADTMAVEVMPYPDRKLLLPVHQHALVEAGVHLIENLVLDTLAREGISTFCLIMLPVKFAGATGSPIRPVAVI